MVGFALTWWDDVVDCPVASLEVFATDRTDRFEYGLGVRSRFSPCL